MRLVFGLRNSSNTTVFLRTSPHARGSPQNPLPAEEGVAIYRISTPGKLFGSNTTYYYKINPNGGGETLWATALIKGAFTWGDSKVTYMGQELKISEFLPQTNGVTKRSRLLNGTNGATFKWKMGEPLERRLDLFDDEKRLVARYGFPSVPFSKERYYIDITDGLVPSPSDVDLILLSATLILRVDRDRFAYPDSIY